MFWAVSILAGTVSLTGVLAAKGRLLFLFAYLHNVKSGREHHPEMLAVPALDRKV